MVLYTIGIYHSPLQRKDPMPEAVWRGAGIMVGVIHFITAHKNEQNKP